MQSMYKLLNPQNNSDESCFVQKNLRLSKLAFVAP